MNKIIAFIKKEFKQLRRQPRQFIVLLIFPILTMFVFGVAFTEGFYESTEMPTIIVIEENISDDFNIKISDLTDRIENSNTFKVEKIINGDYSTAKNELKNKDYLISIHLKQENEKIVVNIITDNSQQTVLSSAQKGIAALFGDYSTVNALNLDEKEKTDFKKIYFVKAEEKTGYLSPISDFTNKKSTYETTISFSQDNLKYIYFNLSWIDDKATAFGYFGLDTLTLEVITPDGDAYKSSARSATRTKFGNTGFLLDSQNMPCLTPIEAENIDDAENQLGQSPYLGGRWVDAEFTIRISVNTGEKGIFKRFFDKGNDFLLGIGYSYYDYFLVEPNEVSINTYYEELSYIDYITPGIIVIVVAFIGVDLASTSIAEERMKGTLNRILSSSIKTAEIILGKVVPFVILTILTGLIVFVIGAFLFNAVFIGSLLILLLSIFVSSVMWVMLALAASSLGRTPLESHLICDTSLIPMLLLSGIFFPLNSMSDFMGTIASYLPMTHSFNALKSIMIQGSGLDEIMFPLLTQFIYIIIFGIIGVLAFRYKAKVS